MCLDWMCYMRIIPESDVSWRKQKNGPRNLIYRILVHRRQLGPFSFLPLESPLPGRTDKVASLIELSGMIPLGLNVFNPLC